MPLKRGASASATRRFPDKPRRRPRLACRAAARGVARGRNRRRLAARPDGGVGRHAPRKRGVDSVAVMGLPDGARHFHDLLLPGRSSNSSRNQMRLAVYFPSVAPQKKVLPKRQAGRRAAMIADGFLARRGRVRYGWRRESRRQTARPQPARVVAGSRASLRQRGPLERTSPAARPDLSSCPPKDDAIWPQQQRAENNGCQNCLNKTIPRRVITL